MFILQTPGKRSVTVFYYFTDALFSLHPGDPAECLFCPRSYRGMDPALKNSLESPSP